MTDIVQKIKEWISKIKDGLMNDNSNFEYLEKEDPVSKDLEEAAKHYLYSNILYDDVYVGNTTDKDCIEMFKAGAKWQKKQMMKEIIDGYVIEDIEEGNGDFLLSCEYLPKNIGLVDQQKVKVVVIKEN